MLTGNSLKSFLLVLAVAIPALLSGQNSSSTSSPYSHFGFGTLNSTSFGRGDGMGGIGIGIRNPYQINTANPASYTSVDSLTFLMQFGADVRITNSKTASSQNTRNNINFNHLTFAFPVTKWWAWSFGLLPYANKGYTITSTDGTSDLESISSFTGTGTLTKAYIGTAFRLGKNISVGVNPWFMFGKISDNTYIYLPNDANAYDYLKDVSLSSHGFGITGGIQYQVDTKKGNSFVLGATIDPKVRVNSTYVIHEERALFRGSSSVSAIVDTLTHVESDNKGLQLPLSYGAGFSYSIRNRIVFGADTYYQKWKESLFLGQYDSHMTNSSRYSAGFEITPNVYSIRSYWERTSYRFGFFYENSYLTVNNTQIKNIGATFGLGLPMSKQYRSLLNVSCELGKLGTTSSNLIRETYARFTIHVMLHDRWFYKAKFD